MPSCSIGFWVASTKKGSSSWCVWPPTVTRCSCIASSSAACVLGGVRLISSARTRLAKSGPFTKVNALRPSAVSCRISEPVMSPGIRSGVNWIRFESRSSTRARVLTMSVLARPGTPIIRQWPPAKMLIRTCSMTASWPTITLPISARMRVTRAASSSSRAAEISSGGESWAERSATGAAGIGRAPWLRVGSGVAGFGRLVREAGFGAGDGGRHFRSWAA